MGIDVQMRPKLLYAHIVYVYPLDMSVGLEYFHYVGKEGFIALVHNTTEGFAHYLPTYYYNVTTKTDGN